MINKKTIKMNIIYNLEEKLKKEECSLINTYVKLKVINRAQYPSEYERLFDESVRIEININSLKKEIKEQQEQETIKRINKALKNQEKGLNESFNAEKIELNESWGSYCASLKEKIESYKQQIKEIERAISIVKPQLELN
jgi:chromosome segregation ATPase